MALQLLWRIDTTDFAAWKAAFDDDGEARQAAGLSVLQIWKDAGNASRAFCLLRVNDRAKAEAFMTLRPPRTDASGISDTEFTLLETL